jgi:hypothetical protein
MAEDEQSGGGGNRAVPEDKVEADAWVQIGRAHKRVCALEGVDV